MKSHKETPEEYQRRILDIDTSVAANKLYTIVEAQLQDYHRTVGGKTEDEIDELTSVFIDYIASLHIKASLYDEIRQLTTNQPPDPKPLNEGDEKNIKPIPTKSRPPAPKAQPRTYPPPPPPPKKPGVITVKEGQLP